MDLGDFGVVAAEVEATAPDAELDSFTFFCQPIRLRAFIGAYPMMRFATLATSNNYWTSIHTLAVLNQTLEACILPDDWAKFQNIAEANNADYDTINEIIKTLYVAWCGRPTKRPTESSDGPQTDETAPASRGKSSRPSRASKSAGSSDRPEMATATG